MRRWRGRTRSSSSSSRRADGTACGEPIPMNSRAGGAVLGAPIAHSLSPALHRAAYDALGLAGWTYRAIECTPAELAGVLRGLDDDGLAGVSLTMPLKK